ncbi:MAG: HAD family hydrolase [Clostridiales bacterium]|nr:HAD family hydrolase [Clostridiales bacterium]
MRKYKGIIFDLDGTLINSIEDIVDSMNEVLNEYGMATFTLEEYKTKIGSGIRNLVKRSLPENTKEEEIDEAVKLYEKFYEKNYLNKTKAYEGIDELLEKLVEMDIKLGINSNKKDNYTKELAKKIFKNIPFIKVFGEREGIPIKPDTTTMLEIVEAMELQPEEVLYIGDSDVDMITGKNANMDTVGVEWGFRSKEELISSGATYIISTPKDLLDIII